ncbi:MAG: polysaccharide deacetylase family protein [Bacillota bacterium]|nr:polysaccharide deacetylase family protein [Bacillota bacterium]
MKRILLVIAFLLLAGLVSGCSSLYRVSYFGPNQVFRLDSSDILLTFDDGPCENTPRVLEILRENNMKAAFFLKGENAARYPELVAQIAAEGHIVGNHTYTHPWLTRIPLEAGKQEILATQDVLGEYASRRWFRPPFGDLPKDLADWLTENGFTIVRWCGNYPDFKPGDIILSHETDGDLEKLPQIIARIREVTGK